MFPHLCNWRTSCCVTFQTRGRRDPPGDLQALHPAAVLSGDVHHGDAQICLLAGIPAAPQERLNTWKRLHFTIQSVCGCEKVCSVGRDLLCFHYQYNPKLYCHLHDWQSWLQKHWEVHVCLHNAAFHPWSQPILKPGHCDTCTYEARLCVFPRQRLLWPPWSGQQDGGQLGHPHPGGHLFLPHWLSSALLAGGHRHRKHREVGGGMCAHYGVIQNSTC